MCLQNINVVTRMYKKTYNHEQNYYYDQSFDTIVANTQDGKAYINDFSIAIHFNVIGTQNDEQKKIILSKIKAF